MSTTIHSDKRTVALEEPEQIDDVRYLEVGDRVRMDGRDKPLTVIQTGTRTAETLYEADREATQHAVQLQGDWHGARKYVVANQHNHWDGSRTGTLIDYDSGRDVTLKLLEVRD